MNHEIDAKNKILGRLATQIALLLRGKNEPSFDSSKFSDNKVTVFNSDKLKFTGKKFLQKKYYSHSGYLGNLKEKNLKSAMEKDSRFVLRNAVSGMLPKNRLRKKFLKNLTVLKSDNK